MANPSLEQTEKSTASKNEASSLQQEAVKGLSSADSHPAARASSSLNAESKLPKVSLAHGSSDASNDSLAKKAAKTIACTNSVGGSGAQWYQNELECEAGGKAALAKVQKADEAVYNKFLKQVAEEERKNMRF